jgi:hypothetical protein
VSERAPLLKLLARVRHRLRVLAAADGAVRGGAAGLAVVAVLEVAARVRGPAVRAPLGTAIGVVALGMALGAAWIGLRRIALARCARLVDRALDGQDRVLSALSFLTAEGVPTSGLARAAVADAVARTRALTLSSVAPARRPRGLPLLAAAGLAVVVCAAFPIGAPAARLDVARADAKKAAAAPKAAPLQLPAEREEARRMAEAAAALDDAELAALARELASTIRALEGGTLPHGEALDRLKAQADRAAQGMTDAERRHEAVGAVGRALEESPATRAAGAALTASDPVAAERALGALAARAAEASAAEREQVARAMEAAGQAGAAMAAAGPGTGNGAQGSDGQRHLKRDQQAGGASAGTGPGDRSSPDRHLERLWRDLDRTAKACHDNPEACRRNLSERAGDLPRMAREAQRAEVWRELKDAARQMRERLRRGDFADGERRTAERRFMKSARGQSGQPGQRGENGEPRMMGEGDGEGDMQMEGGDGEGEPSDTGVEANGAEASASGQAEGAGEGPSAAPGQSAEGAPGAGEGIGSEPGSQALGRPAPTPAARGHEREARLRGGSGPTRSQVIESAAKRGFAQGSYVRVFSDYHAAVEDALEASAVPEGRRYVVRRYFQLIRPRTDSHPERTKQP